MSCSERHTPSPTHLPVSASARYLVRIRDPREYPAANSGASGKRLWISSTAKWASSVKAAEYVLELVRAAALHAFTAYRCNHTHD